MPRCLSCGAVIVSDPTYCPSCKNLPESQRKALEFCKSCGGILNSKTSSCLECDPVKITHLMCLNCHVIIVSDQISCDSCGTPVSWHSGGRFCVDCDTVLPEKSTSCPQCNHITIITNLNAMRPNTHMIIWIIIALTGAVAVSWMR